MTTERSLAIREARGNGETYQSIADRYGISCERVRQICDPVRKELNAKIAERDANLNALILKVYEEEGGQQEDLAARFGVSVDRVSKVVKPHYSHEERLSRLAKQRWEAKTHCVNGHVLAEVGTVVTTYRGTTHRRCRACHRKIRLGEPES